MSQAGLPLQPKQAEVGQPTAQNAGAVGEIKRKGNFIFRVRKPLASQPLASQPLASQPLASQPLASQGAVTIPATQPAVPTGAPVPAPLGMPATPVTIAGPAAQPTASAQTQAVSELPATQPLAMLVLPTQPIVSQFPATQPYPPATTAPVSSAPSGQPPAASAGPGPSPIPDTEMAEAATVITPPPLTHDTGQTSAAQRTPSCVSEQQHPAIPPAPSHAPTAPEVDPASTASQVAPSTQEASRASPQALHRALSGATGDLAPGQAGCSPAPQRSPGPRAILAVPQQSALALAAAVQLAASVPLPGDEPAPGTSAPMESSGLSAEHAPRIRLPSPLPETQSQAQRAESQPEAHQGEPQQGQETEQAQEKHHEQQQQEEEEEEEIDFEARVRSLLPFVPQGCPPAVRVTWLLREGLRLAAPAGDADALAAAEAVAQRFKEGLEERAAAARQLLLRGDAEAMAEFDRLPALVRGMCSEDRLAADLRRQLVALKEEEEAWLALEAKYCACEAGGEGAGGGEKGALGAGQADAVMADEGAYAAGLAAAPRSCAGGGGGGGAAAEAEPAPTGMPVAASDGDAPMEEAGVASLDGLLADLQEARQQADFQLELEVTALDNWVRKMERQVARAERACSQLHGAYHGLMFKDNQPKGPGQFLQFVQAGAQQRQMVVVDQTQPLMTQTQPLMTQTQPLMTQTQPLMTQTQPDGMDFVPSTQPSQQGA